MNRYLILMLAAVIGWAAPVSAFDRPALVPAVYTGEQAQFELVGHKKHKRHHRHHNRHVRSHRHHHYRSYPRHYYYDPCYRSYPYRSYRSYHLSVPGFGSFYYRG